MVWFYFSYDNGSVELFNTTFEMESPLFEAEVVGLQIVNIFLKAQPLLIPPTIRFFFRISQFAFPY